MEKIIKPLYLCLVALFMLQSCKQDGLESFAPKKEAGMNVSVKGLSGQITKDGANVRIPIEIDLSGAATQAFEAHLALDGDAVAAAITGNVLANTLAMPLSSITVPQAIVVPYGATKATFEAVLSIADLEKFYFSGKKVAFAVKLTSVAKGNAIDGHKNTGTISIDPQAVIAANEMHSISIANGGGGKLEVSGTTNYVPSVASIGIPLGVSLSGAASDSFTVDVATNTDTVSVLMSAGVLPSNTVVMQTGEYQLLSKATVAQSSNTGQLDLTIPSGTLLKYRNNKIALVVQLTGSSRYVVHPSNRTVIVLIDPASIILANNYVAMLSMPNGLKSYSLITKFNT
ncbi:hypothetical protein [Pedobacter nutrimenti]|uniref:hypothetical protein n=1 Tax=Pedobacter nutrimenti TaxID=1241337 RepID=UPI00292E9526|nr:hypothetical protein [Pedobacter nutrimenti]